MHHLPDVIEFDAADYPELLDIFRSIDAGIAAIVSADPTLRPKPAHKRRKRSIKSAGATTSRAGRVARRTAA